MFDYDQATPLNIREIGSEKRGAVEIKDITYASPVDQREISAYLIIPAGEVAFPVLYTFTGTKAETLPPTARSS